MKSVGVREKANPSQKKRQDIIPAAFASVQAALWPKGVRTTTRPPKKKAPKVRPLTPEERYKLIHRQQVADIRHRVYEKDRESQRVQREFRQLQQESDLTEIDDDVEAIATVYQWEAMEYEHQEKSALWYTSYAAVTSTICIGFLFFGNFMATLTIGMIAAFTYYIAQKEAPTLRYRIMTEGVAIGDMLYHYQDLQAFNIIYEPGYSKTVILRSKRVFSPLLHMEIGDSDPVIIRDILSEFVQEDRELFEPLVDHWARQLGF